MGKQANKKIFLIALLTVVILLSFYMAVPDWWYLGSLVEFKEWYPMYGQFVYYFINWCLPGLFCICLIVLFITQLENLSLFLRYLYPKLKIICNNAVPYVLQDVLYERKFVLGLFFRLLAFVYFVAFASILWQFQLVSENGLIPYKEFVQETWSHEGAGALFVYPSIFWLCQSDWFIRLVLFVVCFISAFSIFFRAKTINYLILWFVYLSIVNFGRDLFHFPWDTFLLEIGFLSIFGVYFIARLNLLPRILLFAFLLLFFRQWFSMAMVKIMWKADPAWYNLTFMKYYWLNQPSPTIVAWYMYKLPMVVHQMITAATLVFEMLIPLSMLLGRRGRMVAFFTSLLLSFMIELNGNFGFFNILTAILGIWCIDDGIFKLKRETTSLPKARSYTMMQRLCFVVIFMVVSLNLFYVILQFDKRSDHPMNIANYYFFDESITSKPNLIKFAFFEVGKAFSRFRIVAPHGVFKGIGKERQQIQIHVKTRDSDWQPLKFKKGHDLENFYYISPFMNHLPLKFNAHWAYRTEFSFYLKVHPNVDYINSYKANLIRGIFQNNTEIAQLIDYPHKGEVEQIRVLRVQMHMYEESDLPFRYSSTENTILDSLYILPTDKVDFSLFDHAPDKGTR